MLQALETLINPFGDDDDDFEMDAYIDGNRQVSLTCSELRYISAESVFCCAHFESPLQTVALETTGVLCNFQKVNWCSY